MNPIHICKLKIRSCISKPYIVLAWVFLWVLQFLNAAYAQGSLYETLLAARENSVALQRQASISRSAFADVTAAKSALLPNVYLDFGGGVFSRNSDGVLGNSYRDRDGVYGNISLILSHKIWDANARGYQVDAKSALAGAEEKLHSHYEQQTYLNAAKAHFNVLHDRVVSEKFRKHHDAIERIVQMESSRFEHDETTQVQLSLAHAYLSNLKNLRDAASGRLRKSNAVYLKLVGRKPGSYLESPTIEEALPNTLSEAIIIAKRKSPLLKAKRHLIDAADFDVAHGKALQAPTLFFEGSISKGSFPDREITDLAAAGFRLRVPVNSMSERDARISRQHEAAFRARLDFDESVATILHDVKSVFSALPDARAAFSNAKKRKTQLVAAYKAAVDERQFKLRTTFDMLEVHALLLQAELEEVEAQRSLDIARFTLLYAIGELELGSSLDAVKRVPVPQPSIRKTRKNFLAGLPTMSRSRDFWSGLRGAALDIKRNRNSARRDEEMGR
ncbi:MAG: TolC family protein [Rhizobiaceae bacterium]|nr:TolC family protein [Rhizobiaceae bacterium]